MFVDFKTNCVLLLLAVELWMLSEIPGTYRAAQQWLFLGRSKEGEQDIHSLLREEGQWDRTEWSAHLPEGWAGAGAGCCLAGRPGVTFWCTAQGTGTIGLIHGFLKPE